MTGFQKGRYSLIMNGGMAGAAGVLCIFVLASVPLRAAAAEASPSQHDAVTDEEYRIYDEVVRAKFLTTGTVLVVIDRLTTNQLVPPDPDQPVVTSRDLFDQHGWFDSRLPPELVADFLYTNHQRNRLGSRFGFGVPYRFRGAGGEPESDVWAPPVRFMRPVRLIQEARTIDHLAFSRVGFSPRKQDALVYVANDRPDGRGAGFLVWLRMRDSSWQVLETEVIWTARAERGIREGP